MGRDRHGKQEREATQTFVMLLHSTIDSAAWRALSHGGRSLYIALRRRYIDKFHNNGKLFLSQRQAEREIGSGREEIARWFRELQHYGFIVQTSGGCLGVNGKGRAPHWRLTEVGHMKDPPSRDFARWDGTKFNDKKTKSRTGKPGHGGPEIRASGGPEIRPPRRQSGPENRAIQTEEGGPEIRAISKLPSPGVLPASSSSISSPTPRPRPSEARPHSAVASEAGPPLRVSTELAALVGGSRGHR